MIAVLGILLVVGPRCFLVLIAVAAFDAGS